MVGTKLDLVRFDARQVEQIVDEPCEEAGLAIENVEELRIEALCLLRPHHIDAGPYGRERIAKLVREDRDERVLATIVRRERLPFQLLARELLGALLQRHEHRDLGA